MIHSITLTAAVAQIAAVPVYADRTGAWIGTLTLPSQATLRVAVHLRRDGDGRLSGTFDSIDQRIGGIPLAAITITETMLDFTVPTNGGRIVVAGACCHGAGSALGRKARQTLPSR